jgi:hypothetical protein
MRRFLFLALLGSCSTDDWCELSGSWSGTWRSQAGLGGSLASELSQNDSNITGTVSFTGSPCFSATALDAVFTKAQLSGSATAGAVHIDVSASWVKGDLDGTYQVLSGGPCTSDTGTFALTRQ